MSENWSVGGLVERVAGLSLHWKIVLGIGAVILFAEFFLGKLFPRSPVYRAWKAGVEGLGKFWTAIILSVVYLLSVGPVHLVMRLMGRDMLDRKLEPAGSWWRAHEPNPLGPDAAARHQF